MLDIFLSASVPLPDRNRIFFDSADVLLIREAIKSLVEVVLPVGRITCGGHPAITPLISLFVKEAELNTDRLTIFQSAMFAGQMPLENTDFVDVRIVPATKDSRTANLTLMREEMISSRSFAAAVAIGGMEGIIEEVEIFARIHPQAPILPVASTGAAAATVYSKGNFDARLLTDLTYSSLFRRTLLKLAL
jgi:hypothetical protein